jgi:hypothetical protein
MGEMPEEQKNLAHSTVNWEAAPQTWSGPFFCKKKRPVETLPDAVSDQTHLNNIGAKIKETKPYLCGKLYEMEKETIKALKAALPTGWSRIVTERLAARTPAVTVTPRNVQYVGNGKSRNAAIEEELLKLLDEKPTSDFEEKVREKLREKNPPA